MPYSISATLPEKLSLSGNFSYRLLFIVEKYQTFLRDLSHVIVHVNFTLIIIINLIYRNNQDYDRKSYFIRNSELWSLLKSSIKTIHSFSTFLKPPYTLFISQNQKLINLLAIDICFKYNCLGDYRDARTLIGREVHHISL